MKPIPLAPLSMLCLAAVWPIRAAGESPPPGHVDPAPVLMAAAEAMGVDRLRCVSMEGTAYAGQVGQNITQSTDWPLGAPLEGYRRVIDFGRGSSLETFTRPPLQNPASWKYGPGWRGGTSLQSAPGQAFAVVGSHAWHVDGDNGRPVPAPASAEHWQLDIWMTPHGFVRAARLPEAKTVAVWRWELGESGRDGATTGSVDKVIVLSATVLGKYRVNATVRADGIIQRTQTRVAHPVLGDMNYEHEFSNWKDLGDGVVFPAGWHRHDGWDDERQVPLLSGGHNSFGGSFPAIVANDCEAVDIPDAVRSAAPPEETAVLSEVTDGVYVVGGSSHNSIVVEFRDFIAVVEAPLHERRSLAVIEAIVKEVPDKPIRYLVNTHSHYDHMGGLRTYLHIGATVITHQRNRLFYENEVLTYEPRTLEPDLVSLHPPTELSEGYTMEDLDERYILSDGERLLEVYYVQGLGGHAEGMVMAYLPHERVIIEADLFDPGLVPASVARPTALEEAFLRNVMQNRLEPRTVVPVHGEPVTWEAFLSETRQDLAQP